MLCRFFCNIGLLWFPGKKSCIIKVKDKELKIHRYWLPGRLLCSIRSNRKWCKRRGSSLECQNCFFVYPIIDSNLTNFVKSLHEYSIQIQKTDWNGLTEEEKIAQDEDLYMEAGINNYYQDAINIAFEMGLRSGLHLWKQSDFSEEG